MSETTAAKDGQTNNERTNSPLVSGSGIESVADGVWLLKGQGQSLVVEIDEGLVVVDAGPGGQVTAGMIEHLRGVSTRPVVALCYSHGHGGYNAGVPLWLEDAATRGYPRPRVIAHANVPARYARYRRTQGLQNRINDLQFRREAGGMAGMMNLHDPDETYTERLVIGAGERRVHLLWAPSETDDVTAVWVPWVRVLYGSAAIISGIPNIGTPFRTMRDTLRWATTLERLMDLRPLMVVREFGDVIVGDEDVQRVFGRTAGALRWLHAEVVRLMNEGKGERELLAEIVYPPEWFDVPWMSPNYGDPSYIVRDIYRSENGWWDRNPTSLHPSTPNAASAEIAAAVADKAALIRHAEALAARGEHQLALHVIDVLATAPGDAPEIVQARQLKVAWLRERAEQVRSYVSRSIYLGCADRIEQGTAAEFGLR
jgi:alkyl sulfatase BDS1-like metallo-beta-lactamase superfamily hydrolase